MSIAHPHLPSGAPLGSIRRIPKVRRSGQPRRLHLNTRTLVRHYDDRREIEHNTSLSELTLRQFSSVQSFHR